MQYEAAIIIILFCHLHVVVSGAMFSAFVHKMSCGNSWKTAATVDCDCNVTIMTDRDVNVTSTVGVFKTARPQSGPARLKIKNHLLRWALS